MSEKESAGAPAPKTAAAPAVVTQAAISLHEFCIHASQGRVSPELLSAFHHVESKAGRVHGTTAEFKARFDVFAAQPA